DTATNVLSREVLAELDAVLSDLETSDASGLVLLSDKEKGFIAGADVHEFTT
ncbi:MAG: hypothetical protein GWO05_03150, partial [Gammaproteobacteria bacterium]|nr:hypothetical protein [Gammaproteobacteria bacterium]